MDVKTRIAAVALVGGAAAITFVGVSGIAGAQTPSPSSPPSTQSPSPDRSQSPGNGSGQHEDCPDKGGTDAPSTQGSTNDTLFL
jgi:hypothetical protein